MESSVPWPGTSVPLGATWDGEGTNFALFSQGATRVDLCLFDDDGTEHRLSLPEVTAHTWHGYVPGIVPGQRYAFRVDGPYEPGHGQRFNPSKLLIDPYAKAVDGIVDRRDDGIRHMSGDQGGVSAADSAGADGGDADRRNYPGSGRVCGRGGAGGHGGLRGIED